MDINLLTSWTPSLTGNVALDAVCLFLIILAVNRFTRRGARCIQDVHQKRSRVRGLRKTLELKNVEMAELRAAIRNLRDDVDSHLRQKAEDDLNRLYFSQAGSQREFDSEHSDLEDRLQEASRRPHRFDA